MSKENIMAVIQFKLPDIGDFDAVDVIEVLVAEGDTVQVDDSLLTLESDKATMEVPSSHSGVIKSVKVNVGDQVKEGDFVFEIEVTEDAAAEETPAKEEAPATPEVSAPVEKPAVHEQTAPENVGLPVAASVANTPKPINHQPMGALSHASPSVRAFARKLGVDLSQVQGAGPKGRVLQTDVEAFVKATLEGSSTGRGVSSGTGIPPLPVIDFSQFGETEEVELSRIQKISGKHLTGSWLNNPHVTQFDECDITEMDAFRKSMRDQAEKAGVRLTPLVFIMKAVVAGLKEFPNFNASLSPDGEKIIHKKYYNIGIAVDTPNGLVVPVVRDVDQKGLFELSQELMEISARARDGKLSPKDMSGGTFSISSLGGIGGTQFTPIVNAPEVAIMGVSKAKMQPVWNGSEFAPRLVMPFCVSYDHRSIDGAEGVRFTTYVGQRLADIRQLLL